MKVFKLIISTIIFLLLLSGCTVNNPEVLPEIPLYNWRYVGTFSGKTIQHIGVNDEGEILVSTQNRIYLSDNDGKYFYSYSIPDSVDVYKVRKYADELYLVAEMYSPHAGGFWGGTIRLLYQKNEADKEWVKIHGGYLFQDVLVKEDNYFVGALNGVTVVDSEFSQVERFRLFNSKLNDQVDDMIEFQNYLLLSSHEGVFGSSDLGSNWVDLTSRINREHDHILKMRIDENGTLHALANHRAYLAEDDNFEWKIRYFPESYDVVAMKSSNEYAAVDYKRVYHIEVDEQGNMIPYRITPEQIREVDFRYWEHIEVLANGNLIVAGTEGVFIGSPNPESDFWN